MIMIIYKINKKLKQTSLIKLLTINSIYYIYIKYKYMFLLGKMPTNNYKIKIQKLYQSYLLVKIMKAMTKFNKK
jgi:hypothetical protein